MTAKKFLRNNVPPVKICTCAVLCNLITRHQGSKPLKTTIQDLPLLWKRCEKIEKAKNVSERSKEESGKPKNVVERMSHHSYEEIAASEANSEVSTSVVDTYH